MWITNETAFLMVTASASAAAGLWELGRSDRAITVRAIWSTLGYYGTMGVVIAAAGLGQFGMKYALQIFAISVGTTLAGKQGAMLITDGILSRVWDVIAEVILKMRGPK